MPYYLNKSKLNFSIFLAETGSNIFYWHFLLFVWCNSVIVALRWNSVNLLTYRADESIFRETVKVTRLSKGRLKEN